MISKGNQVKNICKSTTEGKMKKMLSGAVLGSLLLVQPVLAGSYGGGIGVKLGTLGFGVEYAQPLNDYFNVRAGLNWLNWDYDTDIDDISYDGELALQSISVVADYHPFANGFRLTAGAFYNNNSLDVTAKPMAGTYTINNVRYPASAIDSVSGEVSFNSIAPYIGLGWGRDIQSSSHWSFNFDLGLLYQGDPDPDLNGRCSAAMPGAACAQFQRNLAVEEQKLKDDAEDIKFYPVISFGVTYSF